MKQSSNSLRQSVRLLLALQLFMFTALAAPAADWDLKDLSGTHYRLSEQKGKWILVNFWAPWCPVCLEEMSELDALQKAHRDFLVIGVAVMFRRKEEVSEALEGHPVGYPVVMGNEGIASEFGEMRGMPTSFLFSPTGQLIGHHDGPLTRKDVESFISQRPDAPALFFR